MRGTKGIVLFFAQVVTSRRSVSGDKARYLPQLCVVYEQRSGCSNMLAGSTWVRGKGDDFVTPGWRKGNRMRRNEHIKHEASLADRRRVRS